MEQTPSFPKASQNIYDHECDQHTLVFNDKRHAQSDVLSDEQENLVNNNNNKGALVAAIPKLTKGANSCQKTVKKSATNDSQDALQYVFNQTF